MDQQLGAGHIPLSSHKNWTSFWGADHLHREDNDLLCQYRSGFYGCSIRQILKTASYRL
jgi:hypothetical protein